MSERKFIKYKEKYIVSDFGEIWKMQRNGLKLRNPHKNKDGYLVTKINGKEERVHRVVMEAFRGKSNLSVDHLNMNKQDNRLSNLEYISISENIKRAHAKIGNKGAQARAKKVEWNGEVFNSTRELSSFLNVHKDTARACINQRQKLKGHYPKYL